MDKHAREHIEDMIVTRLLRSTPEDLEVSSHELETLISRLDVTIYRILGKWSIPGFTNEDLISFMHLKTHQMLRQGKYDYHRAPHSLFYTAFNNLMMDILRIQKSTERRELRRDPIDDYVISFSYFLAVED